VEAKIPKFYDGQVTAYFMGKYPDENRRKNPLEEEIKKIIGISRQKSGKKLKLERHGLYQIKKLRAENADMISEIFKAVFETYPFPIHDADYIKDTMKSHVEYFGAWDGDKLIAVSSAEKDSLSKSVEMTDFATLPEHRGENIALYLLDFMEKAMKKRGYKTAYTIARALSYGMNITFAKASYKMGGTLINNTNICGKIESMNVWNKPLK
jgi:putative beta-lysine N-acetyltransferase